MTAVATTEVDLAAVFEWRRRELLVLCYRMTGSFADAEDLTQETFLRAWRSREGFRHASSHRTWLYRIATNACLDFLAAHERRAVPSQSLTDVLEAEGPIGPFPDWRLTPAPADADPAVIVETNETTELLLLAALLCLTPRQRIALVAREFLGLPATELAALLETSVRRRTASCSGPGRGPATVRGDGASGAVRGGRTTTWSGATYGRTRTGTPTPSRPCWPLMCV